HFRTLAAAKSRAGPEGSVPLPPGEDSILICIAGETAVALLRLSEGRRPFHIHPGHRARRLPRRPAAAGREDRRHPRGITGRRPSARAQTDDLEAEPARGPILPSHPAGEPGGASGPEPARVAWGHPQIGRAHV